MITLIKSCGRYRNFLGNALVACTGSTTAHPTPLSDADRNPVARGPGTAASTEPAVVDQSQRS